jgi:outer membrane protein
MAGCKQCIREMKMKEKIAGLVLICMLGLTLSLIAQEKPIKIGIINTNRIISESVEGKKFLSYLETKQKEKQAEIDAMRNKLQQDADQFQRQQGSLSDEARLRKQSELNKRKTDLDRYIEDAEAEMQAIQRERFAQIQKKIMPIIQQIGSEQNFTLIFEGNAAMLYVDTSIDITSDIITRFDQASSSSSQPPKK